MNELVYDSARLKDCTKCNRTFPATKQFFHTNKRCNDGLAYHCKECRGFKFTHIIPDGTQKCSRCKRVLPKTPYYFKRKLEVKKSGLRYECKECNGHEFGEKVTNLGSKKKRNRIDLMKQRSIQEGVEFNFSRAEWENALAYFKYSCAVCGKKRFDSQRNTFLVADHWIPITKGGATIPSNIVPLCNGMDGCNNSKHNRESIEWLTWRYGETLAAKILSEIEEYFQWLCQDLIGKSA
jgi:hypothetical protein